MFVPTLSPATHAGQKYQEDGSLVAAHGNDKPLAARGGFKLERTLKTSRIMTISLLSFNIEVTRRVGRPKSRTEQLERTHLRRKIDSQLAREANDAMIRLLTRG